ncbi:Z1 domain-containing protein [Mucilaginibacter sp.]|uniref:Z1 domain-containing protein n=1 Tax=Mucilaginibacter sp. TaxID=1882438 RepID=UPI0035BC0A57
MFDLKKLKSATENTNKRYERRLEVLKEEGQDTKRIDTVIKQAVKNISESKKSFVIYGEPQSGKTELMIALTAKLLDEGHQIIVELMNDSVQLLGQNLERFQLSGLSPTPKKFNEILSPNVQIGETQWVIFCKKNSSDLQKLLMKLAGHDNIVVIDDEADYATPNSKINENEQSRINMLTGQLLGENGTYIGVTATPARLDLNRTHDNINTNWIDFPPHDAYTGQDVFFPIKIDSLQYKLTFISDTVEEFDAMREALFSFMVNVSFLNTTEEKETNFSILIHTSGKKQDHLNDLNLILKTLEAIRDQKNENHENFLKAIWTLASERYPGSEDEITKYIISNSERNNVVVMNSDKDSNAANNATGTTPAAPFTIVIGGNIVSRGVTFKNLLSMFFTRDVKNNLQQDTYIQRARMFGARGKHLKYFELTIPKPLFLDWQRCFIFHRLSLESRKQDNKTPVWLDGQRVSAVANASIDNNTVVVDSGEMSFALFDFSPNGEVDELIADSIKSLEKLKSMSKLLGPEIIPSYIISFIESFMPAGDDSLAIHKSKTIASYTDKPNELDKATITRSRGFIGKREMEVVKFPSAIHHINVLYNGDGKARVFYKYKGNIRFLKTA